MARPRSAVSRYKRCKKNDLPGMREAVLYARVSTPDQQREGYSIPSQVKLLEDYAALNGIAVVSSHVDVETARKSGRTAFGNMLRYATGLYSLKDVTAKARIAGMRYRKSGRLIGVSTIHDILRTRLYAGSFDWRGEVYTGVHTSLVSADTWDAVQQILNDRSATNVRAKPHRLAERGGGKARIIDIDR